MKVDVVSDAHLPRLGDRLPVALCDRFRDEGVELILHLGHFTAPDVPRLFEALTPLDGVAGNNDPPSIAARFGRRKIVSLSGLRVGLVHGDGRRGTTLGRSLAAFAEDRIDVIGFGHSHQPLCERRGSPWLVNPGSPTDKRAEPRYSFAIMNTARGGVRPRLVFFDRRA
jgi:putative phosphoesterase